VWADPVAAKALIGVLPDGLALPDRLSGREILLYLGFAGLLFTVIAAACFTNFYGDDGTSLWLTLVVPGAERPDIRGRVWAWFLVVGPAGLLITIVFTAISGQTWSWPWVLAGEPALIIGSAGLLALTGVVSVNAPYADGGPSPARVLKTHLALIVIPVVTLFPAAALLAAGAAGHSLALRWLAVPAGLAWAAWLCRYSVLRAQRRLQTQGPEIFARLRTSAS
jgi:ABC-2 type transport system permease protein